ncbi:MAG TPA: hypothetical protein VFB45_14705 [Pseudolabrys sp.]|nr:hypothetical protein [Pseudolabrys sp.]
MNTVYLDRFANPNPTLAEFTVCHGFGCTERSRASLNNGQWRRVAAVFSPRAATAQAEREQIARGVALIETMVGPQTGTSARQWTHQDNIILPNLGDATQLDCVDDAVNTWTYLTLMERAKLFRFHRVANLSNAGSLSDPFMRNTAVLQEVNGGYYAIDASLVDGGAPPRILPLQTWLNTLPPNLPAAAPARARG